MSKEYNKGRRQGQKDGFIGSVLHETFKGVTRGGFGSKPQKKFDQGYKQGQKDRKR